MGTGGATTSADGGATVAFGATVYGGGGGGSADVGRNGGSGGGAGAFADAVINAGGTKINAIVGSLLANATTYGNAGGSSWRSSDGTFGGGGGGGAGAAGTNGVARPGVGGVGGNGVLINNSSLGIYSGFYWAGGGGGPANGGAQSGNGGLGGGGGGYNVYTSTIGLGGGAALNSGSNGGSSQTSIYKGGDAGANTGGGGGGMGSQNGTGGLGGSGIVIISWDTSINFFGIGIPSPIENLHLHTLSSNIDIGIRITDGTTGTGATDGSLIRKNTTSQLQIWNFENAAMYFGTSNTERMRILADGKIGIGTTAPVDDLHIHNSATAQNVEIKLTDGTTGATITDGSLIRKNTTSQLQLWNFENADMFFGTSNTERMRILADGKIGIGTTAPVDDLHIHNSATAQNVEIKLTDGTTGATATDGSLIRKDANSHLQIWNFENKDMFFGTNNTERIRILADGKVGIGKTPTTYLLDVNGTIGATGYTTVSDYRIKKNIQDVNDDSALQKILALEPKTYNFIDEKERGSDRVYGFLSQQVKEVIPEAIKFSKNVIPNIYKNCDCSSNIIYLDNTSNLFINDTIYITDTDNTGEKQKYEILEVNENSIIINKEINYSNCFVYGKDIDDFHSLDESYIYTINVCATQELHRRIEAQQITINNLTDTIATQQTIINNVVNRITTLENA